MKRFFKRHIGLIILMVLAIVFPVSLSNQTRLNMRILVTGLAIDKENDKYKVTAQCVKISPSTDSGVSGAKMIFISDEDENLVNAMSKLTYKTGKVSAFSHTNFLILGNGLLEEDEITSSMDYFLRNSLIRNSVVVLTAQDKASEQIEKTKNVDLSIGIGIQKVFMYKEKESDGKMISLIDFVNQSKSKSKTALASVFSIKESDENSQTGSNSSENQSQGSSNQSASEKEKSEFFESKTPLVCFVDGKKVGMLESSDEIQGYMFALKNAKSDDITISNMSCGLLKNAEVGIKIKRKRNKTNMRFEGEIPVLDLNIIITDAEIEEIKNEKFLALLSESEFNKIKEKLKEEIKEKVSSAFIKGKSLNADIFGAYEKAYKFKYNELKEKDLSYDEFLDKLRINVNVETKQLEY